MAVQGVSGNGNNNYNIQNAYSSRPNYLNKSLFAKDKTPGINRNFGFGDIIHTMAQAGKAAASCGGNFMAVA
ncbi:MAG: hypothetical protein DKM22_01015 [Candidatus Melainabacteria bacterium]|nr:MAG: hypothetical protein DKM22_01015 [Candidatus Melainabacteria bacterium]